MNEVSNAQIALQHQKIIDEYLNSLSDEQRNSYHDIQQQSVKTVQKQVSHDQNSRRKSDRHTDTFDETHHPTRMDGYLNKENHNPDLLSVTSAKKPIISNFGVLKPATDISTASSIQLSSRSSVIGPNESVDSSNLFNASDVERISDFLMFDTNPPNNTPHRNGSASDRSHYSATPKNTVTKEFQFELNKRRSENRTQEMTLELEEQKMAECTFHPTVNTLPEEMYGGTRLHEHLDKPFFERVMSWKHEKERQKEKLNEEREWSELFECTFKPNVNTDILGTTPSTNIHQKLYINSFQQASKKEEERERIKEEEFRNSCTFKPQLVTSTQQVQPRYMDTSRTQYYNRNLQDYYGEQECTFQPKINRRGGSTHRLRSSEMYLQSNAFDRLSRPKTPPRSDEPQMIEDGYVPPSGNRPKSAPGVRRSTQAPNTKSFAEFLARQNNQQKKKQEKITYIKSTIDPPQKVFINKKSEEMMNGGNVSLDTSRGRIDLANFEKRLTQQAIRRDENIKQLAASTDKGYTFKPKINDKSKALPSRSASQMSQGDYENKQKRVQERKNQIEKREMEQVTFKPKTNPTDGTKGYLRVTSDPSSYMDRLKVQNMKLEQKKRNIILAREQKELKDCTFTPFDGKLNKRVDAPEYVKKIAQSMALTRQNAPAVAPKKPDWR
jgi:hypothetical protein